MKAARASANLIPAELAETALTRDLTGFLTLYGDTLVLLVRLGPSDQELASGLGATAVRGGAGTPVKPAVGSMEFHTVLQSSFVRSPRPGTEDKKTELSAPALAAQLEQASHFAVPLRKRSNADTAYMERISIGRALNKDIVLRHASVSKFHGWFEVDEMGGLHVADAGSKNSTRVNGKQLVARELPRVGPGDQDRFGSVDTLLCAPQTLFAALR
jgi:hypothetical protein